MTEQNPRILFMDDEPGSDLVANARERLSENGFSVDFVETLGEAIDAYYRRYYDIFILDIDMSHQVVDEEGDGVQVLKRFVSLHNQTRVILFSGAGTVAHWFQAANAHCYAYIHKLDKDPDTGDDSIERLLRKVRDAMRDRPRSNTLVTASPPPKVLLVSAEPDLDTAVCLAVSEALGADWTIDEKALGAPLGADLGAYGVILIVQREFRMRASVREALANLLAVAPTPQTIVCCEGRDTLRPSILEIANHHPFRLLDLAHPQWPNYLQEALREARIWYDQPEIQQADPEALRRIHLMLPQDLELELDELEGYGLDIETPDAEGASARELPAPTGMQL